MLKKMLLTMVMVLGFAFYAFASVNINAADVKALEALPGIGAAKAQAIVDYRTEHGEFKTIEDLTKVKGIGEKIVEKLEGHATIEN